VDLDNLNDYYDVSPKVARLDRAPLRLIGCAAPFRNTLLAAGPSPIRGHHIRAAPQRTAPIVMMTVTAFAGAPVTAGQR
jgi:hypothetical protein